MDEPCSALDPIATAKVEELIDELRVNYTIVIVTPLDAAGSPACPSARRCSIWAILCEEGPTDKMFTIRTRT